MLRNYGRHFLFVSALLLGGCGSSENLRIAKEATTHVHAQMDNEQYSLIYSEADDALRAATKQQDFLDFISAVHRKLGRVQNATQTNFFVNFSASGTRVRLNYQTKFDSGDAQKNSSGRLRAIGQPWLGITSVQTR